MNFKKWVKSIQAAAYNGARTVDETSEKLLPEPPSNADPEAATKTARKQCQ